MKPVPTFLSLFTVLLAVGCLCGQDSSSKHVTKISEDVMEYKSDVHNGYSFRFNSTLSLNSELSYDDIFTTTLAFQDKTNESMLFVGVIPSVIYQVGWMDEVCNKDKLAEQLQSQKNLNITEVKSVIYRNYTNVISCIADVTSVQSGVEVPLFVAFADCKNRLPVYAVSGGLNSRNDIELFLETFNC
ncbi:MAG: hypothetical protein V1703_00155 [Candidatus Altiarchaeota archaeon]